MSNTRIQLARPWFDEREVAAIRRVLEGGWVVQGPEVRAFEDSIALMHQARHCIAVSSGTAALHICYLALGIGSGDVVFVPSFAWPSAANMAVMVGARPVFVDVLPDTYNMDPSDLRLRVEQSAGEKPGRLRAVVPVHEFGLAADMDAVLKVADEFGLAVVEDAACAFGATYKGKPVATIGNMGIFSFHARKAITTGEGGAIVTDGEALAERCRMLRNHGQVVRDGERDLQAAGLNYRMTDIQAAVGRTQLEKFPDILKKRRELAEKYLDCLADCPGISLPTREPEHTWQTLMVALHEGQDRDKVVSSLAKAGFGCGPGAVAGHCMKIYRDQFGYSSSDLPVSARLHSQGLALPLHTFLEASDVEQCASLLCKALDR